jgi:hypothetical protein
MRHFYEHLNDLLIPDFRFALFYVPFLLLVGRLEVYIPRKKRTFNPYFSLRIQMLLSSILLLTIETTGMAYL